jgi:hypothetical protein
MARRKKKFNFNKLLIGAVLIIGTWFAADYYFNTWLPSRKAAPKPVAVETAAPKTIPAAAKKDLAVSADGFTVKTYRDDVSGFEFDYPVSATNDSRCAKLEKTDEGLSLGIFSLSVSAAKDQMTDFINSELEGMTIDSRVDITVAGKPAVKIDYETSGMNWNGSIIFVENGGKIFEFGLLANEASAKCNGVSDYEDRVYQSVISTLKFTK